MVLVCLVFPAGVTAQVQVQVVNTVPGGSAPQPQSPDNVAFNFGCWFQVDGYFEEWLWANLYLYLDGVEVGSYSTEGYGQIGGSTYAAAQAKTQDQQVMCYVSSNIGDGTASGYLPGIPDGEITSSGGWYVYNTTLHLWNQTLTGGGNYEGRQVTEYDPGGGGPDYCWFEGSQARKSEAISGGTWTVQSGNTWQPDAVGWPYDAVLYYRREGRAPCDTSFFQDMRINCPGGGCSSDPASYVTNLLRAGITESTVWSERAGQYAERIWP
jgi:hypothetical protein